MSSLLFVNPSGSIWSSTIQKLSREILDVRICGISSPEFYGSLDRNNLSIWVHSIDFASLRYANHIFDGNSLSPYQYFLRQGSDYVDNLIFSIYPHVELLLRHRTGLNWNEHEVLETITMYISQALYFLELTKPSLVVFGTVPHAGWDNVFLLLCDHLGIEFIFNEPSLIYPFSYMSSGIPGKDVTHVCRSEYLSSSLSASSLDQLNDTVDSLKSQNLTRRFLPNYLRGFARFEPFSLLNSFCSTLYGLCLTSFNSVLSTGSLHKYSDRPYGFHASLVARLFFYSALFLRILRSYVQTRKFICRTPLSRLFKKPFIAYFPSFQIEYTSLPCQGLAFSHQACIHKINAFLPPGLNLFVKDHPWSYSFLSSSLTSRCRSFYNSLSRYSLKFLPSDVSPYKIFSNPNCKGVVVNGSTVALEAIASGIPVYETCVTHLTPLSFVKPIDQLLQAENLDAPCPSNPLEEYKSYLMKYCFEFWVGSHEYMLNDGLIEIYSMQMSRFLLSYHAAICGS